MAPAVLLGRVVERVAHRSQLGTAQHTGNGADPVLAQVGLRSVDVVRRRREPRLTRAGHRLPPLPSSVQNGPLATVDATSDATFAIAGVVDQLERATAMLSFRTCWRPARSSAP